MGSYKLQRLDWLDRLERANDIIVVLKICQDICNLIDRRTNPREDDPSDVTPGSPEWGARLHLNNEVLLRLEWVMGDLKCTFAQKRIIAKSVYKIYAHNYRYDRRVFPAGGVLPRGNTTVDDTVAIYGMVFSGFINLHERVDLSAAIVRNFELFRAPGCYSKYFITLAENTLSMQKLDQCDEFLTLERDAIWSTILLNLESPYRVARECMLSILKNLMKDDGFVRSVILPMIGQWSWLNRNKFHLLYILLGIYQLSTVEHAVGGKIGLYDMLELSLHYKHLFSGGQLIVRTLQKQRDEGIFELEVKILQRANIDLVRTMIKQWFCNLTRGDFKLLFKMMQLDKLRIGENRKSMPEYLKENDYVKFIQYMHLFRREFQSCPDLNILLVLMLQIATEVDLDHVGIGLIVETLVHHIVTPNNHIHPSTSVFYIYKLKEYILKHLGVASGNVCSAFVVQCTKLLNYVASLPLKEYELNEDAYGIVPELMGSLVFHRHLQKQSEGSNYHAIITSLRMFQSFAALFLQFTSKSPYRLQENSTAASQMSHLLPVEADTFYDMIYTVEHLLQSDFDDVKATALKLLYNKNFAYHYGPALQGKLSLIYSYRTPSAVLEAMTSFYEESHNALQTSLKDHERDLFAAIKSDSQLHSQIDSITEAFFGYEEAKKFRILESIKLFPGMVLLVNRVVEFVLRSFNCAKTEQQQRENIGSSFEIMDHSLQIALDRSSQRSNNLALDKKAILKALWKTLHSSAYFLENYASWVLDNYKNRLDTRYQLSICLRALVMIMLNCCHRGAIESTGVSFGKMIRKIALLKQCLVVRNDHRNRQARIIVDLAESFFRALVRFNLQETDFRRCRGYLWLIHNFIKNDLHTNNERSYLRIYIEILNLPLNRPLILEDKRSLDSISVIQLHQLNLMVREATLNETILEFIDDLMIIALERFKSAEWPTRNAALQLYSSIVTKLVGQKQQCSDPQCDWPPVYVSLNELIFKLVKSNNYILDELRSVKGVSTPFLILVLEFLSKVEYRLYNIPDQESIVDSYRSLMWRFLSHENDQVRTLAATCFTQLHDFREEIPSLMENLIIVFFTARSNENFRHGLLRVIHFMIRKYVTNARLMGDGFEKGEYFATIRALIARYVVLDQSKTASYRLRCHLLDLFSYLGFDRMNAVVIGQIFNKLAPNNFGLNVFLMRTNALYNGFNKDGYRQMENYEVEMRETETETEIEDE
ncbi:uncharacterized protein LOC129773049 [Toxorhynchites rutilus septentrionalis]|uniref:uncharacterized protein LOC129773049 n=1 Tax=Toxorhynchites rutilus septentrionalis TaxID=329112 RepID=UPI002479F0BD|nr:uncharacterized protein LOC129773049 [Toxorhynchites rutilus septentrionalis]